MSHICHNSVRHNSTAPHLRNKLKVLWLCDIVWPEIVCWIRISSTDVGKASSRQSIDQGLMHLGLDIKGLQPEVLGIAHASHASHAYMDGI